MRYIFVFYRFEIKSSSHLVTGIHHSAIVAAIALVADALVSAGQILAFAVYTIDCWTQTLVYVDGAVWTSVSCSLTVAREAVYSIVAFAVILAGHIPLGIRCAVVNVYLAV